jgi:hypothetical protein
VLERADFCRAIHTDADRRSSAEIGLDVVGVAEAVDLALAAGGALAVGQKSHLRHG